MGTTADQLRQEIEQKREDAAEKIAEIESRVDDTTQRVKETFDLRHQVEQNPLLALGAAMVGGFVLGGLLDRDDRPSGAEWRRMQGPPADLQHQRGPAGNQGGALSGIRHAVKSSGLDDTLSSMTAAVLALVTDKVKDAVNQTMPGFADKFQDARDAGGGFAAKRQATQQGHTSDTAMADAATSDATGQQTPYFQSESVAGASLTG